MLSYKSTNIKFLVRVATVREKCLENEIFFRSGKSQGILWMAMEIKKRLGKSGNLKIDSYGSLQKIIYSVQKGKGCTFS